MPNKVDTTDSTIAEIANRQHGVITAQQLAAVGLGRAAISERTRAGRLHRIHRGVYVDHRGLSLHGRFMAATLACGPGAVLSHTSAAILWELLKPIDGPVHISVPSTAGSSPPTATASPSRASPEPSKTSTPHHSPPAPPPPRHPPGRAQGLPPRAPRHRPHPLRPRVALPRHRPPLHARDLDLRQQGYAVLRYDDRQLEDEPGRVADDVARALSGGVVLGG